MNISTLCRRAAVAVDAKTQRPVYPYFGTAANH
jgi:hypothetical protein